VPGVDTETVRAGYDAANDGDVDRMLSTWDEDVVVHDSSRPDPTDPEGEWHGHEGVRRYFGDWQESFDSSRAEILELIDVGERIYVAVRTRAHGRGSGIPIENERFHVFTMSDGQVVRFAVYADEAEARSAAGL
jgi:ketosteroid isomerase-like protein